MDPLVMGTLQRLFGGRAPSGEDRTDDHVPASDSAVLSSGETYAAIRREHELHRLMLVEMERRGPEATAEDVYDELAARWDAEHAIRATSDSTPAPPDSRADADAGANVMPAWAAEIVEQQRVTNELLTRLVALLEESRGDRT